MATRLQRSKLSRLDYEYDEDNELPETRQHSRKNYPLKIKHSSTREIEYVRIKNQIKEIPPFDDIVIEDE